MAGKSIIEKIIQNHSPEEVKAGKVVWMALDYRSARDFGGPNVVQNLLREYEKDRVVDPELTFFTFDTNAPANTIAYADNQMVCRNFALQEGIRVFDVDAGIGTHVALEQGLVVPGDTAVGTDSHFNIMGAIGAFGQGMGDQDVAFAFRTGKTWFEVPGTIKISVKGRLPENCTSRDLTLKIVGLLGSKGALGKAVEIYGEAIDDLSLAGRITLASMATETGAISYFLVPNQEVVNFCQNRSGRNDFPIIEADPDAVYEKEIEIDVMDLKPQIACPPRPDNVVDGDRVSGKKVDSVFLGSCTNGRFEDMKAAADILQGQKVAPGVMMRIVPATKEVYGQMLKEGLLQIFYEAGAIVSNPGCGGCAAGQIGMTGKGEVQVSTSNRNFPGKQGAGETYLASPVTAVWSAVRGTIAVR